MTSTGHASAPSGAIIATDIPARLDRLRWGRFHTLVVVALGITWILDGLEVTLAGAIAPALKESPRLHFSRRRFATTLPSANDIDRDEFHTHGKRGPSPAMHSRQRRSSMKTALERYLPIASGG